MLYMYNNRVFRMKYPMFVKRLKTFSFCELQILSSVFCYFSMISLFSVKYIGIDIRYILLEANTMGKFHLHFLCTFQN